MADYGLHDLGDEARYRLHLGSLQNTEVVRNFFDQIDFVIGFGVDRVRQLGEVMLLLERSAAGFSEAVRKTDVASYIDFCGYMEAATRGNAGSLRSELSDIAAGHRTYGGFCAALGVVASQIVEDHHRSRSHISQEDQRKRRLKDVRALSRLLPFDHRPARSEMYDAIKAGDVDAVKALLPILEVAMNAHGKDVFAQVPPRAPQTLRLIEEDALQPAFAANTEIAQLAGWTPKGSGPKLIPAIAALVLLGASTLVWQIPSSPGLQRQVTPIIHMAARPGTERG